MYVKRHHRRSRAIRLKNSALVLESAWKQPFTLLVIVIAPCFCTPRMTMHMWLMGRSKSQDETDRSREREQGGRTECTAVVVGEVRER